MAARILGTWLGPWPAHLAALAALAAVTALTWATAPDAGFVRDAWGIIVGNPFVQTASWDNVRALLTHDYTAPLRVSGLYRPVTMLSYLVDWSILGHGARPAGYIAENVFLHFVCAALVYGLVWRLCRRRWPALVAGALFAVHPIATEAVTNVVGRADLLATFGVLGGLHCYAGATGARGVARVGWAAGLAAAATLAFFSKENGIVLVAVIALWDLAGAGLRPRLEHAVVLGVLAVYLGARWLVAQGALPPADVDPLDNPIVAAGFWSGRLTAAWVLVRLLALLVWPATLSADYSNRQIPVVELPPASVADWGALAAAIGIVCLPWALLWLRRRHRAAFFLAAFAAVALVPTSNLIRPIGSIMAERFAYLPLAGLAGLAALLAAGVAASGRRRVAMSALVLVVLAAGAVRTVVRNRDWRDDLTLWTVALQTAPASARVRAGYAASIAGPDMGEATLDRVIAEYELAVSIHPEYAGALANLGAYYLTRGDRIAPRAPAAAREWYERAVASLERAAALDRAAATRFTAKALAHGVPPDRIPATGTPAVWNNLALAYRRLGKLGDALEAYEAARRLTPRQATVYVDISATLLSLGRWEDAAVVLLQAIDVAPHEADAARRLAQVGRAYAPEGAALLVTRGRTEINLRDPLVHRHRCLAWRGLARIFAEAALPAMAADAARQAAACHEYERSSGMVPAAPDAPDPALAPQVER